MNTKYNMKNPNFGREQMTKAQLDGQAMGQRFAAQRAIPLLQDFFKRSELLTDLYDLYNFRRDPTSPQLTFEQFSLLSIDDLKIPWANAVGLAYALGYIDRAAGLKPKDLKNPKTERAEDGAEDDQQLELPGVLD